MPVYLSVSFARTPLNEIGAKVEELEALGWRQDDDHRGDPWVAVFVREFPEETAGEATAELRHAMGDYWVDAGEMRGLRQDVSDPGVTMLAVFKVLEKRIARLEEYLERSAFQADPRVLAEGEYLKAQLSGVEGTEGPSMNS